MFITIFNNLAQERGWAYTTWYHRDRGKWLVAPTSIHHEGFAWVGLGRKTKKEALLSAAEKAMGEFGSGEKEGGDGDASVKNKCGGGHVNRRENGGHVGSRDVVVGA